MKILVLSKIRSSYVRNVKFNKNALIVLSLFHKFNKRVSLISDTRSLKYTLIRLDNLKSDSRPRDSGSMTYILKTLIDFLTYPKHYYHRSPV